MHKFQIDDVVLLKDSNEAVKIYGVEKSESGLYDYVFNLKGDKTWAGENELERINTQTAKGPTFCIPAPSNVLYAFVNLRTSKIDHYEHEWAGNQFSKRCPQYDISRSF